MKLLMRSTSIFDRIIDSLAVLAAGLIICMMLTVCLEVFCRNYLNHPQMWVSEINENMLVWFTFLSAAWILKREGHVKVEILVARLNARTQMMLGIICSVMGVILCLLVAVYGTEIAWTFIQKGTTQLKPMRLPQGPLLSVVPICTLLLSIQFLRRAYAYVGRWRALQSKEQRSEGNQ